LGSERQQVMPTEAIAALVEEATPPDVKRALNPVVTSAS
jgi:threonyl-tRNA synthetase